MAALAGLGRCGIIKPYLLPLFTQHVCLFKTDIFDSLAGSGGIGQMEHTVFSLHQIRIFILPVVCFIFLSHKAFAPLHPPDDREGQTAPQPPGSEVQAMRPFPA